MNKNLIINYINSNKIITCISLLILYNFTMTLFYAPNEYLVNGFLKIATNNIYICILSLIFLTCTFSTMINCDKSHYLIMRMNSKKDYFIHQLKYSLFIYIIIYLSNLIILFTFLNLFSKGLKIENYLDYNISNIIYIIFTIVKHFVFYGFIVTFFIFLIKFLNKKVALFFTILISSAPISVKYILIIKDNNNFSQLFHWNHLRIQYYESFIMESITVLKSFFIYLVFTLIVYGILIKFISKKEIK